MLESGAPRLQKLSSVGRGESQIDPWDKLLNDLYEDLNPDDRERILRQFVTISDIEDFEYNNDRLSFIEVINGVYEDHMACADQLHRVLKEGRMHNWFTGENLGEKVDNYIQRTKSYHQMLEVTVNNLFVGREEEVKDIVNKLESNDYSGVVICGIGGQGKSQLARQVCWSLMKKKGFRVASIDLRNTRSIENALNAVLSALERNTGMYIDKMKLLNEFKQYIFTSLAEDLVVLLDDCDHLQRDTRTFQKFLLEMTNVIQPEQQMSNDGSRQLKVKLLLTMRVKLGDFGKRVASRLYEHSLRPLEELPAVELLKTSAEMDDIDYDEAVEIVERCARSPLAITVVSELLKSGKFTPQRLIVHLEVDKKNKLKGIGVHKCLQEAIDNLDESDRAVLVALSVFQSSVFDLRSAHEVVPVDGSFEKSESCQRLHNCHLLEATHKISFKRVKDKEPKTNYSLHPLVYQYIVEWSSESPVVKEAITQALHKFIRLYEKIIDGIVQNMDSRYWKGRKKLSFHRVHIMKFYEILSDHPKQLPACTKELKQKEILSKKRVSDLADLLLSNVQKRRMFMNEAKRAKKVGDNSTHIFWKVEEADVYVMLHDRPESAMEILDGLSNGKCAEPFYNPVVHGLFNKVKGLCQWKEFKYTEALQHLQLAIDFYDRCNPGSSRSQAMAYKSLKAKVLGYMGQIYIDVGDHEKAEELLTKAFDELKSMVESRDDSDELKQELQWNIPPYYYHFAVIKIRQSKAETDVKAKERLLDRAMNDLRRGAELDRRLKLDYLDNHLRKLKAMADIFMMRGEYESALKQANYVLDRRRDILQPPHFNYAISVYQVAKVYMLMGEKFEAEGDNEKANEHWIASSDYFKELRDHHIKDLSIPLQHPAFQEIKADHIKLVTHLGVAADVKKVKWFYQTTEKGGYARVAADRVKDVKKMLWTPVEVVKKILTGATANAEEFGAGDAAIQRFEDMTGEQQLRMFGGGPSGSKTRQDSGTGMDSSFEYGDSEASGSGSLSQQMHRVTLQTSTSLEDNAFQSSEEHVPTGINQLSDRKTKTKRQKTKSIDEA